MNIRRSNKIWQIWSIVGISLFVLGCPLKSGVEKEEWFRLASKYDQALSEMWASEGDLKDFNEVSEISQKFLYAKQPAETEIIFLIQSPNRKFQRICLAAMSLKPIETDQMTNILFEFLQDHDPIFRWYAVRSLGKLSRFPESKKAELGKQLLEIVKTKKENELIIEDISLLGKFPSNETAFFLTKQLMKEGEEKSMRIFRLAAFRALKEMGNSYYDGASEYVKNHGSSEIRNELSELEKSWILVEKE